MAAYGKLIQATQAMSLAVAVSVLRDPAGAEDAAQEAYLRAYRSLGDLEDPAAFRGWLRRIVIAAALNLRRARRVTLLSLDDVPNVPVLDETETHWSDAQRHRLAAALLTLSAEERRIYDRRYHGGWPLAELHHVDENRILRYDLTLPLLLTARYEGRPIRVWSAGKTYRVCEADARHLEAFHQLEVLWLDDRDKVDQWRLTARVLESVDRALPGRAVKIVPVQYPMCARAWELEVEDNGEWLEVLAWGVFTDRIVAHLGGDPVRHTAMGVGYGLERFAMLRYGIDDIRKIDVARVA